jgi:peptide-methionine (S)-S-oxide reductase
MTSKLFVATACLALVLPQAAAAAERTAVLAGGCFWSVEHALEKAPGVKDVVSGYAGGRSANPTYRDHEGHLEVVQVTYDPDRITYAQLLDRFFRVIDPTDKGGQFCDRGPSYRTAVFAATPEEKRAAEQVKAQVARTLKRSVATEIRPAARFWRAEGYHQDYAHKNPVNYNAYRVGCRRDARLKAVWAGR